MTYATIGAGVTGILILLLVLFNLFAVYALGRLTFSTIKYGDYDTISVFFIGLFAICVVGLFQTYGIVVGFLSSLP